MKIKTILGATGLAVVLFSAPAAHALDAPPPEKRWRRKKPA